MAIAGLNITHTTSFINGEFLSPGDADDTLDVLNPSTKELLATINVSAAQVVDDAVAAAKAAQKPWAALTQIERADHIRAIADGIVARREEFISDLIIEQGKIRETATAEVDNTVAYFRYMAEWARRIEGEVIPSDRPGELILLRRRPIGVVGAICPWNFPLFLIARKVAPALITGSTVVLKPAEDTPLNAIMFAEVVREAGLPAGVFNLVLGKGDVGTAISSHADIDFVTFTGSTGTGSKVMESASKHVTKVTLELGGKAPAIVLNDASVEVAVQSVLTSRTFNNGQVCVCTERVYVESGIADEFIAKVSEAFSRLTVGNPAEDDGVDLGPLINQTALDNTTRFLEEAVGRGATVVAAGTVTSRDGYFFPPTVLRVTDPDDDILVKEVFGPILPIYVVADVDEAIALANRNQYGLASSLFTNDLNKVLKVTEQLEVGESYVNRENDEEMQGFHAGVKASGIGGADGKHAIEDYTTTHVTYIQQLN